MKEKTVEIERRRQPRARERERERDGKEREKSVALITRYIRSIQRQTESEQRQYQRGKDIQQDCHMNGDILTKGPPPRVSLSIVTSPIPKSYTPIPIQLQQQHGMYQQLERKEKLIMVKVVLAASICTRSGKR
jgi:hypothetical protein